MANDEHPAPGIIDLAVKFPSDRDSGAPGSETFEFPLAAEKFPLDGVAEDPGYQKRSEYLATKRNAGPEGDGGSAPEPGQTVKPRVTVVIPARNEAKNLPFVLSQMPKDIFEVILVDGHSTDDTVAVVRAVHPRVRVVQDTRSGKGNALACGFAAARGDIIVTLDADGSADASEIPRFVAALLAGADYAKGSRFLAGAGSSDITRIRRMGNRVLTTLVNLLFGTRYTDLCYGYNAFWSRCLPVLNVDCDGFEVETLINIRVAKANLCVREVVSFEGKRIHGVSNLSALRDGRRVLKTILQERWMWGRYHASQRAYEQETATTPAREAPMRDY
ncbi:MAG: putative glycosyltransferase [Chloroflexi bacterium]|nr:putative glycosyltransferase [Chloroflexota bacterium]